jgi:hypothetical protein
VQGCEPRLFGNAAWVSLAEAEVDASPSTMAKVTKSPGSLTHPQGSGKLFVSDK